MLTTEDLALARELLAKVREIGTPRPNPRVKAGELPELLNCSRCTSWKITKDPTFPRPIVLSERLRLWDRAAVLQWMEQHRAPEKRDARPIRPGAEAHLTAGPRGKRGTNTNITDVVDGKHGSPKRRRRATSALAR